MTVEPPLLEVRGLCKDFGDKKVLQNVDMRLERGETVVIVGGSGCGKTTLARLLIGLDQPTSGQVLLEGVDLATLGDAELTEARRRFAMVFQRAGLLDSMNVFDNVAFPLRERGHDESTIHERVLRTLTELGVAEAAGKLPGELSGGMAKRVGIARAMVVEPEILVYDEPTSGLDPVSSRVVDGLIERMRQRFLVSSVVITHDMISAFRIADRILLLSGGRVLVEETPAGLSRTDSPEIRAFATSSGVELEHLVFQRDRPAPDALRARWELVRNSQRDEA